MENKPSRLDSVVTSFGCRYTGMISPCILVICIELRWRQLCSDPVAPCSNKLKLREEVEPLDTGGDTHKQPILAQVCRTLKGELCTESANIGAAKN